MSVFSSEDHPNALVISYAFEFLRNILYIRDRHRTMGAFLFAQMTADLPVNNRGTETLGMIIEKKVMS
jgi:hypothetical protein